MSLMSAKKLLLSGSGLRAETRALIDRMTVKPNRQRARAKDNVIKGLIADGIWPLVDGLYVYAAQDIRDARLNWKQNRWNVSSSTGWQAERGFIGQDNSAIILYRPVNPRDFHMQGYFTQFAQTGITFGSHNSDLYDVTNIRGNNTVRGITMGSRSASLGNEEVGDTNDATYTDFIGGIYSGDQFILNVRERVTTRLENGTPIGAREERMELLVASNAPARTVFQSVGRAMTAEQMRRYRQHIRTYLATIGAL